MRMVSIASRLSSNFIYIGSDSTHLLVDAGNQQQADSAGVK